MTAHLRVFVSSVQKELEDERLIIQNLVSTDPFLAAHCTPVLYEFEPASPDKALEGCLRSLDACHVYLLIVAVQYGTPVGEVSITHAEYRRAKARQLPVLAFIRGERQVKREAGTVALLAELDADGPKYKRFGNVIELQKEVRAALLKLLLDRFGIAPSSDENLIAEQTIEATSAFESQAMTRLAWRSLDHAVARQLIAAAEGRQPADLADDDLLVGAMMRGLIWRDPAAQEHFATAAGILILPMGHRVDQCFPQSLHGILIQPHTIEADHPHGMPGVAVDKRHGPVYRQGHGCPDVLLIPRVTVRLRAAVGVCQDPALGENRRGVPREQNDAGRKIMLEVFADRLVVSSPGLPPAPITLASLRRGKYRPCSRNPVLAQCLSYFHRIEERGSGIRRMRDQMLDHGLDPPLLATEMGYFQIVFPGPGESIERIRVPDTRLLVTQAVEARLNERQKAILAYAIENGTVTSGWCRTHFKVAYQTVYRDLNGLLELGLLTRIGSGRSTRYAVGKHDA
jgi:predicted HTH transcriptional regulator